MKSFLYLFEACKDFNKDNGNINGKNAVSNQGNLFFKARNNKNKEDGREKINNER